jgi:AcrR family transcriptional regulator
VCNVALELYSGAVGETAAAAGTRARREAILSAALAAFTEKGFAAATIEDMRRISGASVGSIYHHFGGKEELAAALYVDGLRDYQNGLVAVLTRSRSAEAGIRAAVRHHLRWVERNPDLARFLLRRREAEVLLASQAAVRELNRHMFAAIAAWLRAHVESGTIRALPLDLVAMVLIGPSQEFARHWLDGASRTSIRRAERELAAAAWRALSAEGDRP